MLQTLHIQNLLLLKKLDVRFASGLNIISGESGAGKSLVLYGLALLLGARFDRSMITAGCNQAFVSGVWHMPSGHILYRRLAEMGITLEDGEDVIVRRVLGASSGIYINDMPISLKALAGLATCFAEMYVQFAAHRLAESDYQRQILDDYAGLGIDVELSRGCFRSWQEAVEKLQKVADQHRLLQEQASYIAHTLEELQELDLRPGEIEDLQEQRREIRALTARMEQLKNASNFLNGRGQQGLVRDIDQVQLALSDDEDEVIAEVIDGLERARIEIVEAERTISSLLNQHYDGEASLEDIESRLFRISELARKHQTTPEQLHEVLDHLAAQAEEIEELARQEMSLGVIVDDTRRALNDVHSGLSRARAEATARFSGAVSAEFAALNMPNVAIQVELVALAQPSATGLERIQILMRTQSDADWQPVLKIASGGEMTRVLLAIALCLGEVECASDISGLPLIFDEIDAGMGGETAALLGARMKNLAATRQVLAVTHSPQMAACADAHFMVRKQEQEGSVCTEVTPLEGEYRREEIARMLAGERITPAARAAADALLAEVKSE